MRRTNLARAILLGSAASFAFTAPALAQTAAETTQALVSDVARYQGDHPTDDVTLLVLRRVS